MPTGVRAAVSTTLTLQRGASPSSAVRTRQRTLGSRTRKSAAPRSRRSSPASEASGTVLGASCSPVACSTIAATRASRSASPARWRDRAAVQLIELGGASRSADARSPRPPMLGPCETTLNGRFPCGNPASRTPPSTAGCSSSSWPQGSRRGSTGCRWKRRGREPAGARRGGPRAPDRSNAAC